MDTRAKDQKAKKVLNDFLAFSNEGFCKVLHDEIAAGGVKNSKQLLMYKDTRAKLVSTLKGTSPFFKSANQSLIASITSTQKKVGLEVVEYHRTSFSQSLEQFAKVCIECCKKAHDSEFEAAKLALQGTESLLGLQALNLCDVFEDEDACEYASRYLL